MPVHVVRHGYNQSILVTGRVCLFGLFFLTGNYRSTGDDVGLVERSLSTAIATADGFPVGFGFGIDRPLV